MRPFCQRLASMNNASAMVRGWRAALLLLAVLTLVAPAYAQVLYGTLTGEVTDPTGAVVAGAKVTALNVGTNVSKLGTTNERGLFTFNDLQPGVYDLTVEAPAFNATTRKAIRVDTNAVRRVDTQLQVAGVTDTVEVSVAAAPLQTDRADIHITQTARQVNDLPLTGTAGRNYQSIMTVVPGAVMMGEQNSAAGSPQRAISFNVNGVSRLQNSTKLDGASIVYPWLPTNTAYVPSAEAIEEVSISTNSYNAEQGMAGGAAINVIIRSGTNRLRGTAWGYTTDSDLKARNFFQTTPKNPKDTLNQYGGNLGGPVIKDKLFFFANWEHTSRVNNSPTRILSLAPDALRRGDFSGTGVTSTTRPATPIPPCARPSPATSSRPTASTRPRSGSSSACPPSPAPASPTTSRPADRASTSATTSTSRRTSTPARTCPCSPATATRPRPSSTPRPWARSAATR